MRWGTLTGGLALAVITAGAPLAWAAAPPPLAGACVVARDAIGDATINVADSQVGVGVIPSEDSLDVTAASMRLLGPDLEVRLRVRDLVAPNGVVAYSRHYWLEVRVDGRATLAFYARSLSDSDEAEVRRSDAPVESYDALPARARLDLGRDEVVITASRSSLSRWVQVREGSLLSDVAAGTDRNETASATASDGRFYTPVDRAKGYRRHQLGAPGCAPR